MVFLQQRRCSDAAQVLRYARDLYRAQDNQQWEKSAQDLLHKAQSCKLNRQTIKIFAEFKNDVLNQLQGVIRHHG